jgi:hypothetical protein
VGIFSRAEVNLGFGGMVHQNQESSGHLTSTAGLGDLSLGTKLKFLDTETAWASQTLLASVKFPTADADRDHGTGGTDYDLTWVISKPLGDVFGAHLNVGYTWLGHEYASSLRDQLHYGVAGDARLSRRVQLVMEVFASTPNWEPEDTFVLANFGVRWQVLPSLVLDAAAGAGFREPAPDFTVTAGLTWLFGLKKRAKTL